MSIKPIDYNVILPKSQELNSYKIAEQMKQQNVLYNNIVHREKIINQNMRKVLNTERTENLRITADSQSNNKYEKHNEKENKNKKSREKLNNKKKNSLSNHKIDIQI
ncbi:MAG TPA: hypothetical protein VIK77_00445 [Tissierellaceae bacterium]